MEKCEFLTGVSGFRSASKNEEHGSFSSAIKSIKEDQRTINSDAILSILMKNYPFFDDTVVKGVERLTWMQDPETGSNCELPNHGSLKLDPVSIAKTLYKLLLDEISLFVLGKFHVGILLSGGMDSRIVASVLKELQVKGVFTGSVTALTWGVHSSRDVIYSKRIADLYKWDFKRFELTPEALKRNIVTTAEVGAGFSPVHMHAMPDIAQLEELDCILAGSYGDSIGRGEYSGKHVSKVPFILENHLNKFGFMKPKLESQCLVNLNDKVISQRARFKNRSELAHREIELQQYYMRRQLNSCMEIINANIPVHQAFTSPSVFGFIWSLSPECRGDETYYELLKICAPELLEIPWARTGKVYNSSSSPVQDNYPSLYHAYGRWLRNDCREFVLSKINDGSLQSLNVFDGKALIQWSKHWSSSDTPRTDRLDEKMAWLASLAIAVRKFQIKGLEPNKDTRNRGDLTAKLLMYKAYRVALMLKK